MELKKIQSSIFNVLSQQEPASQALSLITGDNLADAATRLRAYQSAHRIRLREVIEEDFSLSTELWGEENFHNNCEQFISEVASPTYNINELGRYWLLWLEQENRIDWPDWLIPLSQFEWHLFTAWYQTYSKKNQRLLNLGTETPQQVKIASATQVRKYQTPVDEIYNEQKTVLNNQAVSLIIWNIDSDIHFERLSEAQADLWNILLASPDILTFQNQALQLRPNEVELGQAVHQLFEFGSNRGILEFSQ